MSFAVLSKLEVRSRLEAEGEGEEQEEAEEGQDCRKSIIFNPFPRDVMLDPLFVEFCLLLFCQNWRFEVDSRRRGRRKSRRRQRRGRTAENI